MQVPRLERGTLRSRRPRASCGHPRPGQGREPGRGAGWRAARCSVVGRRLGRAGASSAPRAQSRGGGGKPQLICTLSASDKGASQVRTHHRPPREGQAAAAAGRPGRGTRRGRGDPVRQGGPGGRGGQGEEGREVGSGRGAPVAGGSEPAEGEGRSGGGAALCVPHTGAGAPTPRRDSPEGAQRLLTLRPPPPPRPQREKVQRGRAATEERRAAAPGSEVRCVVAAPPLPGARPEPTLLVALIAFTFDRLAGDRPLTPAASAAATAGPCCSAPSAGQPRPPGPAATPGPGRGCKARARLRHHL